MTLHSRDCLGQLSRRYCCVCYRAELIDVSSTFSEGAPNTVMSPPKLKPLSWAVQEEMHLTEAGIALCHSFRAEQTAVMGFLLSVDKVLSTFQRGCLESFSYPWSPEWLKLCALICQKKGRQPYQFPSFGNQQLNLPILPHKSAFEVQCCSLICARH